MSSDLLYKDGRYSADFEDFAKKAADGKTTLFIFCNPHNPSGRVWTEKELRTYLDENFRFTKDYLAGHLPLFFAYKAGVLLEGGNMFAQNSDGFIRLNLACPEAVLAEGLKRICEAVRKLVNLGISLIPTRLLISGIFLICCTISTCIGTSMGTQVTMILALAIGTGLACVIGMGIGSIGFFDWAQAVGSGMEDMFWLAVFAMMVSGMMELVRHYGGVQ